MCGLFMYAYVRVCIYMHTPTYAYMHMYVSAHGEVRIQMLGYFPNSTLKMGHFPRNNKYKYVWTEFP